MKHCKSFLTVLFCLAAAASYGQTPESSTKPDNTKVNKRDRNAGEVTADQQRMNASDQAMTKKIRQSVMADKSLSTYAHNIKIISQNGTVTLKDPSSPTIKRKSLIAKAVAVTGRADKVTDQISVK